MSTWRLQMEATGRYSLTIGLRVGKAFFILSNCTVQWYDSINNLNRRFPGPEKLCLRPIVIGPKKAKPQPITSTSGTPSANPVKNYKCSWVLVNDASGPSQADFASTHTNLPFFVNYIWFIILRVNYNYVGKLQLVIIDCNGLAPFVRLGLLQTLKSTKYQHQTQRRQC